MELSSLPSHGVNTNKMKKETKLINGKIVQAMHYNSNGLTTLIEDLGDDYNATVEFEYDDRGNEIHEKRSNGYEKWLEYDKNGRLILSKDSSGSTTKYEYDDRGNMVTCACSNGGKYINEYNDMNCRILSKIYDKNEKITRTETIEYNSNNKITKYITEIYNSEGKVVSNHTSVYEYYEEKEEE